MNKAKVLNRDLLAVITQMHTKLKSIYYANNQYFNLFYQLYSFKYFCTLYLPYPS